MIYKMNSKTKIILVFLILFGITSLFISGCETSKKTSLPKDFVITLYSDGTSSGASRTYNARIVFNNGTLVDGYASYTSDDTLGVHRFFECVVERSELNGTKEIKWVNATVDNDVVMIDGSNCDERLKFINPSYPPLTIEEYEKLIDDQTIIEQSQNKSNCHYEICYEIELLSV
jgi:hypothetical protein